MSDSDRRSGIIAGLVSPGREARFIKDRNAPGADAHHWMFTSYATCAFIFSRSERDAALRAATKSKAARSRGKSWSPVLFEIEYRYATAGHGRRVVEILKQRKVYPLSPLEQLAECVD